MSIETTTLAPGPTSGTHVIRDFRPADSAVWDRFVRTHPEGTFFHLSGWKNVIERTFRHPTHYLLAEVDGRIAGVLPLGQIRSVLFGNALISTPFCVYGGVLATDESSRQQLLQAACSRARSLGVDYLELRCRRRQNPTWPTKNLYVTFRKPIDSDPAKNLAEIPRKQRAMIRRGIKAGLQSELDADGDRLFRIYSESVRNLGTPVFPIRLFRELRREFAAESEVMTVVGKGRAVASVMSFYFRDEVLPYYGGSIGAARGMAANDFMYWEVMCRAAERGVKIFDYGRSKREVGSYRFKKHWGFEPEPLFYEYFLVRAKRVPDVNPLNPKYRMFVETWKRLPLPISRLLGPWIARDLG